MVCDFVLFGFGGNLGGCISATMWLLSMLLCDLLLFLVLVL